MKALLVSLVLVLTTACLAIAGGPAGTVAYPDGYRDWRHVKSMVIEPGHPLHDSFGGIHHLYANERAMKGYRKGSFPDGSVIVFDLLASATGGNAVQEGDRKVLGVMQRDRRAFAATGGWGFEAFVEGDANRRLQPDAAACYACHTSQAQTEYVFSRARD